VPAAPAPGGLLAVHAHPDDETLSNGGLLAVWAAAGLPVTVVTCTRGELGEVIGPDPDHLEGRGPALAAHRELELAAALAALGVRDHVFLDTVDDGGGGAHDGGDGGAHRFSDSGMAWAGGGLAGPGTDLPAGAFVAVPLDAAARRLARVLRERRPGVVVTYEPGGGYGHPDHVRAHEVTMRALELAGDPAEASDPASGGDARTGDRSAPHVPAVVLWTVVPDDALRAAYRELAELPAVAALLAADPALTLPDPDGPLATVAVPASAVGLAVDVTDVLPRVVAALGAHRTQVRSIALDPGRIAAARSAAGAREAAPVVVGCYALSNDVLAPLLSRESYRRAPAALPATTPAATPAAVPSAQIGWPAGVRQVR